MNNVNQLTNFLDSGKTLINMIGMYILTYLNADQFCIDNLMRWCFFFKIQERHFACKKQGQQQVFEYITWPQILILGTFLKILFSKANFEQIFQPGGKSQDLAEPCFPYMFYPSFIPPIRSGGYSSFNLNYFLARCEP